MSKSLGIVLIFNFYATETFIILSIILFFSRRTKNYSRQHFKNSSFILFEVKKFVK